MRFALKVQPAARKDIQDSIKWYNRQQKGLGKRFHAEVKDKFEFLRVNPFFQNRYETGKMFAVEEIPVHGAFLCFGREESGGCSCRFSYFIES